MAGRINKCGTAGIMWLVVILPMTFWTRACFSAPVSTTTLTRTCHTFYPVLAFGDSLTDTGNAVLVIPEASSLAMVAPYGNTFFAEPTGRHSDGRLMVDFLCAAINVSFLLPHFAHGDSINENFAVAGATSLDVATLEQLMGLEPDTPYSIADQIDWFVEDMMGMDLSNALVYFGEMGGYDYKDALIAGQPVEQIAATLVTPVLKHIATSLDTLLSNGIKKMVVQGQFPMGCIVLVLTTLSNLEHDKYGCIAAMNAISDHHNRLLWEVIASAVEKYPDAEIVFFDTLAAYLHILDNAAAYGFTNTQNACYPILLPDADQSRADIPLCPNPENYMGWDGVHFTDALYGTLMELFLGSNSSHFASPYPNFLSSPKCATSTM